MIESMELRSTIRKEFENGITRKSRNDLDVQPSFSLKDFGRGQTVRKIFKVEKKLMQKIKRYFIIKVVKG